MEDSTMFQFNGKKNCQEENNRVGKGKVQGFVGVDLELRRRDCKHIHIQYEWYHH
jgi:hypothetical protein